MSVKTTARSRHQPFMASPSQRTIDGCITLRSSSSTYQWGVLPSNVQSLHSSAQSCTFLIIKVDSFIKHTGCPKVSVCTFGEDNSVIDCMSAKPFEPPIMHSTGIFLTYDTPLSAQNHPGLCWKQF